jgi:thymidylate synthase
MKQYQGAMRSILGEGTWQENRTGIDSIKMPYPIVMYFNMRDGFPALTGRRAAYKSSFAELIGFMRGYTSAADFRELGCKFWDQNANENAHWLANPFRKGEDDLGDVYGAQWRRWPAYKSFVYPMEPAVIENLLSTGWKPLVSDIGFGNTVEHIVYHKEIDQLGDCIRTLIKNPNDRRILFHAWNPAKLDEIALPACHLLYQFVPCGRTLNLSLTLRSNDFPLGAPANIMEAAALLHIVAHLTGFKAGWLTTISNDAHIYRNQMDMVNEYLERPTQDLPKLVISDRVPTYLDLYDNVLDGVMACENDPNTPLPRERADRMIADTAVAWLDKVEPHDLSLAKYRHGEPLSAPMAV